MLILTSLLNFTALDNNIPVNIGSKDQNLVYKTSPKIEGRIVLVEVLKIFIC
jgi:hypothetical protein